MSCLKYAVSFMVAALCLFYAGDALCGSIPAGEVKNIVLTPADQLILDAIEKVNERIDKVNERIDKVNERIDKVNERIDNLWITMLGGFMGVMGFIGALVFWDRRTFMKRARSEMGRELEEDRHKIDAMLSAMKKLGARFPEVGDALRSFGLF